MKAHIYIYLISILVLGCKKKEYPQPTTSTPEYFATGSLNQTDFSISAGINNIQLTTKKYQNKFGVYEYVSSLNSITNANETELRFKIFGHSNLNFHENETIEDAIHLGPYSFAIDSNNAMVTSYNLYSYCSDNAATVDWIIDSQNYLGSSTNSLNTLNTLGLFSGNTTEIFHLSNGSTFFSEIQYPITTKLVDNFINLSIQSTINSLIITPIVNKDDFEDELELISFSFNGQAVSKTEPITTPLINNGSLYLFTAQYLNKKTSEIYSTVFNFSYSGNFEGTINIGEIQTNVTNLNTNNIKITYTKNGIIYKSSTTDINSNTFTINSIEEGPLSPTGKPTKKIKAQFSGHLMNTLNELDLIYFENTNICLVFEY